MAGQTVSRRSSSAPFSGRVADRIADPGTMLAAGAPVFTLVDDSVLEFRAAVPSRATTPRWGLPRGRHDRRPARSQITGRVTRIAPLVEERNRSFEHRASVTGRPDLVGGLFARAGMHVRRVAGALLVPPAALVREGAPTGEAQTFVMVDQGGAPHDYARRRTAGRDQVPARPQRRRHRRDRSSRVAVVGRRRAGGAGAAPPALRQRLRAGRPRARGANSRDSVHVS